jgi:acyl-CoA reductase-like NAD-dependent aldehyde dehydrogenase
MSDLIAPRGPFVAGTWRAGEGEAFAVTSPASEAVIATLPGASLGEFEAAIGAAR